MECVFCLRQTNRFFDWLCFSYIRCRLEQRGGGGGGLGVGGVAWRGSWTVFRIGFWFLHVALFG